MKLSLYFQENGINQREWSEEHGFSYGYIRMIACERRTPSLEMAREIFKATKGRVTPLDLLPEG